MRLQVRHALTVSLNKSGDLLLRCNKLDDARSAYRSVYPYWQLNSAYFHQYLQTIILFKKYLFLKSESFT